MLSRGYGGNYHYSLIQYVQYYLSFEEANKVATKDSLA